MNKEDLFMEIMPIKENKYNQNKSHKKLSVSSDNNSDIKVNGNNNKDKIIKDTVTNKKKRKILIVVDVQNDFITGSLGNDSCVRAAENIVKKLNNEADKYDGFYFTKDIHFADYLETLEGKKLPIEHCIKDTKGSELIDGVQTAIENLKKKKKFVQIIEKHTFGSTYLAHNLKTTTQDYEIEICGVCTDICVVSNALALRQAMPNMVIKVNPSCCAGTTKAAHKAALRVMHSCQIDIITGGNYKSNIKDTTSSKNNKNII